ncbi:MAG: hypothetical protein OXN17_08145 [Candidatus Poribacteria bacterium]|nr:hypothetical protein [Candidatus Poribacteria bacterium]MDE0503280.1 hypothetical protein [Candidatus Poribacteria bacterium]
MKLLLVLICLIVPVSGCSSTYDYIVYRDVPDSPSFVVLPANSYMSEATFAIAVEKALISCWVKVVRRPGTKQVTTEQAAATLKKGQLRDSNAAAAAVQGTDVKRVEHFREYEDISADYLVETYADEKQVRISNKETDEILAVFYLPEPAHRFTVYHTLKNMGVQVHGPEPTKSETFFDKRTPEAKHISITPSF